MNENEQEFKSMSIKVGNDNVIACDDIVEERLSLLSVSSATVKDDTSGGTGENNYWFLFLSRLLILLAIWLDFGTSYGYGLHFTSAIWFMPPIVGLLLLNKQCSDRFSQKTPLSKSSIFFVEAISIPCINLFTYTWGGGLLLNPFFFLWLVCQSWLFYRIGKFLGDVDEYFQGKSLAFWLPLCANLFVPFSLLNLDFSRRLVLLFCQLVCQILALSFVAHSLKNRTSKKKEPVPAYPLCTASGTVIRYNDYSAFERWFRQFLFSDTSSKPDVRGKLISWFFIPLVLMSVFVGMQMFDRITHMRQDPAPVLLPVPDKEAADYAIKVEQAKEMHRRIANQNFSLMLNILLGLASVSGGLALYLLLRPNQIAMTSTGVGFRWERGPINIHGKITPWSQVTYVGLDTGNDRSGDPMIIFHCQNEKHEKLKINAVETDQEKAALLNSIQQFAPNVERDPALIECLQPSSDHSYTELWLQALSAPPKRERLKPLRHDASVNDGAYRVVSSLGVGGQGQAYLATNEKLEQVVLKEFILPVYVDVTVRKSALEQFQNEAHILQKVDHPNIVKLIDFFVEDHRAYLVLEHIDGSSLRKMVEANGKLPEDAVRKLAEQMCKMLIYLHGLAPPIVHRDFTPDNLILHNDGTLKLIDFNVAKQIAAATAVGTVVGKHAYLPPEQFRGRPVAQSDIYALGATLAYLLTGQDPVPVSVSSPATQEPSVSLVLDKIIQKATAINLADRYACIEELQADLQS